MKIHFRRLLVGWLALFFLLVPLSGCSSPAPTDPVAELLDYLTNREYARIYKLLDPTTLEGLTLAQLSDRYEAVYDSLEVLSVDAEILTSVALDEKTRRSTVMFTYVSSKLGEINMGSEITMRWRDDRWMVVWTPALLFPGLETGDELQLNIISAQRGEIFDVNGELLASNDYAITVYVRSGDIKDPDALARLVAPVLEMTETDILKKIDPDRFSEEEDVEPTEDELALRDADVEPVSKTIILKTYPKDGLPAATEEGILLVEGLQIDRSSLTPIRYYPYGSLLAHTLGYTGVITAEDLEKEEYASLPNGTFLGRTGLEAAYDETLRGTAGYELAIYKATGEKKQILASVPAVDGSDLRLSVDLEYQQTAELLLQQHLTSQMSGCVIVLDPATGAVDALASYPTFDVNLFSYPVDQATWASFMDKANQTPLFNRTTIGLYPPGSTFKPFVGGWGLDSGAITLEFAFDQSAISSNTWKPANEQWVYPPIRRVSATRDPMNLNNSIINSDNIFFAYTALTIGDRAFIDYCKSIGLTQSFGFDLPVATSRITNDNNEFSSIKLLADSGYGQGEILISPLQMASTFGSLANGGCAYSPYVVASIRRTEKNAYAVVSDTVPTTFIAQTLPSAIVETLQPMLRGVVTNGTAKPINVDGLEVHGKTGTAQIGSDNSREIAWISGYNTAGLEKKLVCVMVEVPADQGDARNNIAKALFNLVKTRGQALGE